VALEYLKQTVNHAVVDVPQHVWVLDSSPGLVPDHMAPEVARVIAAVKVRSQ
jgi:hypothetical protein